MSETETPRKPSRSRAKTPASTEGTRKKATATAADAAKPVGGKAGHRQTLPTNANVLGNWPYAFIARRQYQNIDLSTVNPGLLSPQQLIDLLSDADPDISLALWNFLLLVAGKWDVDARTPQDAEDPAAKTALNEILSSVNREWGGFQNLLYQFVMSVVLQGACSGETIPTDDLKDVRDIVSVACWTIFFQRTLEQDLIAFQWQPLLSAGLINYGSNAPSALNASTLESGGFRLLNTATFGYVPFMPMVDDPYGRLPFASVFQIIVFDNQLLKDLRQWSHVNAWGRIDVSVVQEMLESLMPAAVKANKKEAIAWINDYMGSVQAAYNSVGPDDSFIHLDNVKVGSVDSSGKTFQIDMLLRAIERKKFRSLRMLPILMGSNEGTTETHGSVQWDIMVRGIQALQVCVATLANTLLTSALRLRGFTSHAVLEFESLRSTDRIKDAQAEAIEIRNAASKRDQGWITQDEASIAVTGSTAIGPGPNPDPLVAMGQPDSGSGATPTPAPAEKETTDESAPAPDRGLVDHSSVVRPTDDPALVAALQQALTRALTTRSAPEHLPPSPARTAIATRLAGQVATRLRAITVSDQVARELVATHTSNYMARSRRTPPVLADGIASLIAKRANDGGDISPDEREALKANIALILAIDIPDSNEGLVDELAAARLDGANLGGVEGLAAIGIDGSEFTLTNAQLLSAIDTAARAAATSIQGTTRDYLATAILETIEANGDVEAVQLTIATRLNEMADWRGAGIGDYETDSGYFDSTLEAWQRNGITEVTWTTDTDPDPGAGKGGATPCRDNSYSSPIPIGTAFPSGDYAPPAHLRCRCGLRPGSNASELAMAEPWLGA